MKGTRALVASLVIATLSGCAALPEANDAPSQVTACVGTTEIPVALEKNFRPVEDPVLLRSALGAPEQGKLCQGQVYEAERTTSVTVFRAWNSTNPNSRLGKWWVFDEPTGSVASYRSRYEICYQWSALDKLVRCTLKPGTRIVLGTGQSAWCSEFLTYPVSPEQQVYVPQAASNVVGCEDFDGVFRWE